MKQALRVNRRRFLATGGLAEPRRSFRRRHVAAPSDADAYLAGPPVMVREVVKVLNSKGIGKERIHYDAIAVR